MCSNVFSFTNAPQSVGSPPGFGHHKVYFHFVPSVGAHTLTVAVCVLVVFSKDALPYPAYFGSRAFAETYIDTKAYGLTIGGETDQVRNISNLVSNKTINLGDLSVLKFDRYGRVWDAVVKPDVKDVLIASGTAASYYKSTISDEGIAGPTEFDNTASAENKANGVFVVLFAVNKTSNLIPSPLLYKLESKITYSLVYPANFVNISTAIPIFSYNWS